VAGKTCGKRLLHGAPKYCVSEGAGIVAAFESQASMANRIIVIPAYNEERTIADVVSAAVKIADRVLVVDDGSRDQTAALARKNGALVVRHAVNRGVGAALGTGIEAAVRLDADAVVTMDADGQHRAEDAAKVFDRLAQGDVDFVIGSRMKKGDDPGNMPIHRVLFNTVGNLLTFFLFGVWVTDSQSGLRGLSSKAARTIELRTNGMESLSEFIKEKKDKHWRFDEVAIKAIYTDYSMSKGQNFFVGVKVALRLIWRRFFG
jgi:UDP-N-acetylglucosamine---dolichyl-phosphate N-acetylglucosaminyltransferase